MKQWVETQSVVQRMRESSTIPREQRVVQTDQGLRINPEYQRRVIAENHRLLEILAEDDGPETDQTATQ